MDFSLKELRKSLPPRQLTAFATSFNFAMRQYPFITSWMRGDNYISPLTTTIIPHWSGL